MADHLVEADPAETDLGLERGNRIADENDALVGGEDVTGIFGEAALQADVDRTAEMTGREIVRLAAVEQHRAVVAERDHVVDAHRLGVLCPR